MKKYRLTKWCKAPIEEVEVVSETASTVTIREVSFGKARELKKKKSCHMYSYHDSWLAAHAALLESAQSKVSTAERVLKETKERLAQVKAMKQPAVKP